MSERTDPLRVAVLEDRDDTVYWFEKALGQLGHRVTFVARTAQELLERARADPPDVVLADIRVPDGDGILAAELVYRERPVPVVLVSAYYEDELVRRAEDAHVMAYLVKPVEVSELGAALALAVRRFRQMEELRREATELRQALEDRKVIERAKGAVMRRLGLDEQEAYRRLRKHASDHNFKLTQVAARILEAEETFRDLER